MERMYRKKVWFRDLIKPEVTKYMNLGFHFEVFRWMVRTGRDYSGVNELLSKQPSCIGFIYPKAFEISQIRPDWNIEEELKRRFEYAILSKRASEDAFRWRRDHNIFIDGSKIINLRCHKNYGNHIETELFYDIVKILQGYRVLKWSPNEFHKDAVYIWNSQLRVEPDCYVLNLQYSTGFHADHRWDLEIVSRQTETFFDFLCRAHKLIMRDTYEYREKNKIFGRLRKATN